MLPGTLMTVPSYLILHWLKWIDTYYALIIPSVFNAFGIFLPQAVLHDHTSRT